MTKDIKGTIHYLFINIRYPFIIFWTILLSFFGLSLIISTINGSEHVLFQASIPIYIFSLIYGLWMVENTIPYLIKMSITRKTIYTSIGLFFLILAIVQAILANTLTKSLNLFGKHAIAGDLSIVDGQTEYAFQLHHLSQFLPNDTIVTQITIDSAITFSALVIACFIGLIFYRFGLLGGFSSIAIAFGLLMLAITRGTFTRLISHIVANYTLTLYMQLFALSLILYAASYLLLRRLTIR